MRGGPRGTRVAGGGGCSIRAGGGGGGKRDRRACAGGLSVWGGRGRGTGEAVAVVGPGGFLSRSSWRRGGGGRRLDPAASPEGRLSGGGGRRGTRRLRRCGAGPWLWEAKEGVWGGVVVRGPGWEGARQALGLVSACPPLPPRALCCPFSDC